MSTKNSFCWLRLLDSTIDATESSERARSLAGPCGVTALHGGRPPGRVGSLRQAPSAANQGVSGLQIGTVAWTLQAGGQGANNNTLIFDHGPAFDEESDAMAWMGETEGQVWAAEAMAHVLIGIHLCNTELPALDASFDVEDLDNAAQTPAPYVFDASAWGKVFLRNHLPRRDPACLLLRLEALDPRKHAACTPPAHHHTAAECDALLALQKARTDAQRRRITHESQSTRHAIEPVLTASALAQGALSSPALRDLIAWVADSVDPVIFLYKRWFMRARPVHMRPGQLQPMFPPGSRQYPGHPAYPSGHASMAHVWALLLARCGGGDLATLTAAAESVAHNREIAGVHFKSDGMAGKELAAVIVDHMLDPQRNPNHAKFAAALKAIGLTP